ncbi:MAG: HAMP domain-containing histidine kinase, partial [Betaproteobacteria bacterium]|nr:HAMP domain-containing histidine kinase [Betaproteobacteria bacterium]
MPLTVPLIYGAKSINQLSKQVRQMVHQVKQIERYSKILVSQLEKMEHSVKLSHILNDASVLDGYYQSRSKFREALAGLSALQLTKSQMALLEKVDSLEAEIFLQISKLSAGHEKPKHLRIDFAGLQDSVNAFLSKGDVPVERKMDTMQAMADDASRITLWLVVLMMPFAVLLAFSVSRLITTPIQQINGAIQSMGSGGLSKAVKIDGPQDLQRLGEKLEWLRASLLELEREKTTFLLHVSHELKTPLTSIREGAGLLSEGIAGQLTDKQKKIAAILLANSIQLQKRIEDLLNFNALLTGKTVLAQKTVAIRPVIEGVIQDHRLALENKELKTELLCPDCTIEGDEQKIRIIV